MFLRFLFGSGENYPPPGKIQNSGEPVTGEWARIRRNSKKLEKLLAEAGNVSNNEQVKTSGKPEKSEVFQMVARRSVQGTEVQVIAFKATLLPKNRAFIALNCMLKWSEKPRTDQTELSLYAEVANMEEENVTNEQLVARIQAGVVVPGNMLRLWQQNRGFIALVAKNYQAFEDIEDLKQEGYIGLCRAVDEYKPQEGVVFMTYAG